MDLCRRPSRRRPEAAAHYLPHDSSWLAFFVLGLCSHRVTCRCSLVHRGSRYSGGAPASICLRARCDSIRTQRSHSEGAIIFGGGRQQRRQEQSSCALAASRSKPRSLGGHHQLFLLRLRRVDFLQLVLPLSRQSTWTRFEGERLLFHAAL